MQQVLPATHATRVFTRYSGNGSGNRSRVRVVSATSVAMSPNVTLQKVGSLGACVELSLCCGFYMSL